MLPVAKYGLVDVAVARQHNAPRKISMGALESSEVIKQLHIVTQWLQVQQEELLEIRYRMIHDNERTIKYIRKSIVNISNDQENLIPDVVELEARKMTLDDYLAQVQIGQDLSQIQGESPDQTVHDVRYRSPPTPQYVNADSSSPQFGGSNVSTPYAGYHQNHPTYMLSYRIGPMKKIFFHGANSIKSITSIIPEISFTGQFPYENFHWRYPISRLGLEVGLGIG